MNAPSVTADAAGTWRLGDLTVNRLGFGAMRLTGDLSGDGTPRDRGQSPVGEHFAALAALRDAGLVRHLGLSNVTVGQIDEALAIAPVAAVQNRYSIDSRRPEADDVLRACAERGIAFVPFFAIAGEGPEGG
ncbi:MAG: pyridoxine 4-dehydrogenase, partial [Trebonia sp.]|nr:pyridoxine 4-dehydrogenase [Trebonia sp.]